jgi:drug/metabolite transporter (DMT)-like permease
MVGVISFAFGAILIKYSSAHPLAIAFYRLLFATILMALFGLIKLDTFTKLRRIDFMVLIFNGLVLAIHFALWISSLNFTTVAASVILVDTSPFFATFFAYVLLREKVDRRFSVGLILCFVGAILILGADTGLGNIYGDILSLGGAVLAGLYFYIGRKLRPRINFVPYVTFVYGFSALFLFLFMLVYKVPFTGYTETDFLIFLLLAIGPSCLGHNSCLKYMKTSNVSATVYGEAFGSTLLAVILFNETPSYLLITGGALILLGIYFAVIR